jgi:membrane-bound lytic murein transglycosylase D
MKSRARPLPHECRPQLATITALTVALLALLLTGCASGPIPASPAPVVMGLPGAQTQAPAQTGAPAPAQTGPAVSPSAALPPLLTSAPTAASATPSAAAAQETPQARPMAAGAAPPAAPVTPPPRIEPAPTPAATVTPVSTPNRPPAAAASVVTPQAPLLTVEAQAGSSGQAPTQVPTDLWDRIRRGFAMPDLTVDLVKQQEKMYTARPEYLERMVERSRKYLFHIVEELELRNMPTELALLPFVESAFNPQAVSIAKAAGIWQFMPATGRHFDLKQNVFRDDRRDVMASTRAALDYLQRLHGMFGDWHLALASYNWGEGSVGRAIARNQRAGLGTRYPDLRMPDETRYYVPRLQALKNVVASPGSFNVELPLIPNHPYFQDVEIKRDIDVALAARLADVKPEDFRALNPSANRPVILAAGTGKILLPWDNAEVFKRNLQAHSEGRLASWTAWSVPSTMSVAEAARRSGMSESELRSVNNIPPRMLIKAGSTLVVPRAPHVQADVSDHLADNGSLALAPEVVLRKTTVKARKGDTVDLIARRHKVNAENLAEWNKVGVNAGFRAGEAVVLYLPARPAANQARGKARPQQTQQKPAPQKRANPASPAKKSADKR